VRCRLLLALLLLPLVGCGRSEPPRKEPVAAAVRQWFKTARVGDQDRFCSWTFMAYDVPTRLWKRIGADFDAPGPQVAPPPLEVERNCHGEYSFTTFFDRPIQRATRVVGVRRIRIGSAVQDAGGITNTASAVARIRDKEGLHDWPLHLVQYRGRWRILLHYD
jgi:hypothetical protein